MKYLQESRKYLAILSAIVGATLLVTPNVLASSTFVYTGVGGAAVNAVNGNKATSFTGDVSNTTSTNLRSSQFNFVGMGGNDTFNFIGGNQSVVGVGTGAGNDTFYVISSVNVNGSDTFSLLSHGKFVCMSIADQSNGTATYALTAGANSTVQEANSVANLFDCSTATSVGLHTGLPSPVWANAGIGGWGSYVYSINVGDNSSVVLSTLFAGNKTDTVNVVF